MHLPDLNPSAIVSTLETAAPALESFSSITSDIRVIQSWHDRELELAAIREFGDDWDGRGSSAPTGAALQAAAVFLAVWKRYEPNDPPARIALSPSGALSVDWLDGNSLVRAEIMDLELNEIEWMRASPGLPTEFWTTPFMVIRGTKTEQVQTWQPAQIEEEEPALAFAR